MVINRQSPLPLYLQLADILRRKIETGEYPPGAQIPSEPALAKSYRMGRPTIRQALGLLVQERSLFRRKGAGTFVREKPPPVDLFSLAGTSSAFLEKGLSIAQRMTKKTSLITVRDDPGNPFAGRPAYFFARLSLYRGEPILLEETYLNPDLFHGIDRYDFAAQSLAKIAAERFYARPSSCRQFFRVVFDPDRARTLKQGDSAPLLLVARELRFPDCPAGVFSRLFCRTDRFTFSQTFGGTDES